MRQLLLNLVTLPRYSGKLGFQTLKHTRENETEKPRDNETGNRKTGKQEKTKNSKMLIDVNIYANICHTIGVKSILGRHKRKNSKVEVEA
jgi:hypothetical protein